MNDHLLNEGFLSEPMLQQSMWLEWLQPFLYGLLAIAFVSLVIALLDLAMLLSKEFHTAKVQETAKARTKSRLVRKATTAVKTQSYGAIKVLLLLLCFSPAVFAHHPSQALNTVIRDGYPPTSERISPGKI